MPKINNPPLELVSLQSRALLAADRVADGLAIAKYLTTVDPAPEAYALVSLADKTRNHDENVTTLLLARARTLYPESGPVAFAHAMDIANRGEVDAARVVLKEATDAAVGKDLNELTSLSAIFESRFNTVEQGHQALVDAARKLPDDIGAQLALLNSPISWSSEEHINEAIDRLRKLTGENATGWRTYKARQLLMFGRTKADTARASQLTSEVLLDDPTNIDARVLAGDAWLKMNDRTRAIEQYRAAAELGGHGITAYPSLIELLLFDGQRTEAERFLRMFMEVPNMPDELVVSRGMLLARAGMINEATPDLEYGIEIANEGAALELIRISMRRDDQAKAQQIVDSFLARPGTPLTSMIVIAADLESMQADADAGLVILEQLPDDAPSFFRTIAKTELLNRFGRIDDAKKLIKPFHERGVVTASAVLARIELDSGNPDAATAIVNAALQRHPNDPGLKKIRSRIGIAGGNSDVLADALYTLASAAANNSADLPGTPELLNTLERFSKKQLARDSAILEIRRITADAPTNFDAWRVLATLQMDAGKLGDAAKSAHAAAAASPNDPRAQEFAARTLQFSNRHSEAVVIAKNWSMILGAQSFEPDCFLATIESTLGNAEQAYKHIEPWIDRIETLGKSDPDKAYLLGVILAQNGHIERASTLLWPADPTDTHTMLRYLTAVNVFTDNPEQARTWISRAEPALSQYPDGRLALADKWYKVSITADDRAVDHQHVVTMLEGHAEKTSEPAMAYLMLAASYQELKQSDKAETTYRRSLELAPDNTKAMNNLAYLLIEKPSGLEEAVRIATNAVDAAIRLSLPSREIAAYRDTLGLALLRNGRPRESLSQFELSSSLNSTSGSAAIGLAEAYLALDKVSEARSAISKFDRIPGLKRSLAPEENKRLIAVQNDLKSRGG